MFVSLKNKNKLIPVLALIGKVVLFFTSKQSARIGTLKSFQLRAEELVLILDYLLFPADGRAIFEAELQLGPFMSRSIFLNVICFHYFEMAVSIVKI